jgi:uncharacterized membrane protein
MTDETRQSASTDRVEDRSIILPGVLLGLGLGGLFDGIVLHQILQWHHMRSGDGALGGRSTKTVGGLEANTLADGAFHAGTLLLTIVGLFLLWNRVRSSEERLPRPELAWLLILGWGIFNVVEGVVDHHLLGVHHVRDDEGAPLVWDLAFLAWGTAMVVIGYAGLARARWPSPATSGSVAVVTSWTGTARRGAATGVRVAAS